MMNSGSPTQSAGYLPDGHYAKQGWNMLDRDFSLGEANPLQIVVDGPGERERRRSRASPGSSRR